MVLTLLSEQGQFMAVIPVCSEFRWSPFACWQFLKRFASVTPVTQQHKVKGCTASKRQNSKRVKRLLIQRHQFTGKLLNTACQGKSSRLCFDLQTRKKKEEEENPTVIFIKRSSFTPSARPQLQGNQTHLFSPEERSSLTAAFKKLLVKCTHQVFLFSYQSNKNAPGNCSDTVMTCNIQICLIAAGRLNFTLTRTVITFQFKREKQSKGYFMHLTKGKTRPWSFGGYTNILFHLLWEWPLTSFTLALCNYVKVMKQFFTQSHNHSSWFYFFSIHRA